MQVQVRDGDLESALGQFRRLIGRDGIMGKIRFRALYPNLSDRRREKDRRAKTRKRKREARRAQFA